MAKTTPTRGSDQYRAAAASDRDHPVPSSTERARAINAARFGRSYISAPQAKQKSTPHIAAGQTMPAASSTSTRPPITNKTLPNMSRQMSSRHQLPNGRSRTGFNTPAEVQEAKKSAYRKFPAKAHAVELAAREERGVEKIDRSNADQVELESIVDEEASEAEFLEVQAAKQRQDDRFEQNGEGGDESEYDCDA